MDFPPPTLVPWPYVLTYFLVCLGELDLTVI